MIIRQGRKQTAQVYGNALSDVRLWDGPVRQVVTTDDPAGSERVVIGHVAYGSPRSKRWDRNREVWHATTETDPTKLERARWWSVFENTGTAEVFLLGLWLGRQAAEVAGG